MRGFSTIHKQKVRSYSKQNLAAFVIARSSTYPNPKSVSRDRLKISWQVGLQEHLVSSIQGRLAFSLYPYSSCMKYSVNDWMSAITCRHFYIFMCLWHFHLKSKYIKTMSSKTDHHVSGNSLNCICFPSLLQFWR